MKTTIIQSNSGNHSGFDRKWSQVNQYDSLEAAQDAMLSIAFNYLSDDIIEVDGLPFDSNNNEVVYDGKAASFTYDGRIYMIVTEDDDIDSIFNGGYYGYAPSFLIA